MSIFDQKYKVIEEDSEEKLDPNIILSNLLSIKKKVYDFEQSISVDRIKKIINPIDNSREQIFDQTKLISASFSHYQSLDQKMSDLYSNELQNFCADGVQQIHQKFNDQPIRSMPAISPIISAVSMLISVNEGILNDDTIIQLKQIIQEFIPSYISTDNLGELAVKARECICLKWDVQPDSYLVLRNNLFDLDNKLQALAKYNIDNPNNYSSIDDMFISDLLIKLAVIKVISYNQILDLTNSFYKNIF